MKSERYGDKTIYREKLLIEFITKRLKEGATRESFSCDIDRIREYNDLLLDPYLAEEALDLLVAESDGNLEYKSAIVPSGVTTIIDGDVMRKSIWVRVRDYQQLQEQESLLEEKIKELENVQRYVLEKDGSFYPEARLDKKFNLETDKRPYGVLNYLAKKKRFVKTQKLAEEFETTGVGIRKVANNLRDVVEREFGLPRETLLESDNKSGYRVTNVKLKK